MIPLVDRLNCYWQSLAQHEAIKRQLEQDMPSLFLSARMRVGLTQRELAERLGVSHTYISKIEHGLAMPGDDLLRKYQGIIDELQP